MASTASLLLKSFVFHKFVVFLFARVLFCVLYLITRIRFHTRCHNTTLCAKFSNFHNSVSTVPIRWQRLSVTVGRRALNLAFSFLNSQKFIYFYYLLLTFHTIYVSISQSHWYRTLFSVRACAFALISCKTDLCHPHRLALDDHQKPQSHGKLTETAADGADWWALLLLVLMLLWLLVEHRRKASALAKRTISSTRHIRCRKSFELDVCMSMPMKYGEVEDTEE